MQNCNTLDIFLRSIQHCSYSEKYRSWKELLDQNSDNIHYLLTFLEYFPFNYTYWAKLISLQGAQHYRTALTRNPKSFQLWIDYLKYLRSIEEASKYKKQLQRGIIEIGADTRSITLYKQYFSMISDSYYYEFYKKVLSRALIGLQEIYQQFQNWFQSLTENQLKTIYTRQIKGSSGDQIQQKAFLLNQIDSIYSKTLQYRTRRIQLQNHINCFYFNGSKDIELDSQVWRALIELQRENGVVESISYCYQRSLLAQTTDESLWQQAFHYLENQTNKYSKVLAILRNNKNFFMSFSTELYFYCCDMEQRQNINTTRNMYIEIEMHHPSPYIYDRYIQFQIRQKQWSQAKDLYDRMMVVYRDDTEILCHVLVDYSEFVLKYYKDYDYSKKLLKMYFDLLPFNEYLFTNYLQFMKNYQNKQGYYDQLMEIIQEALIKAKKNLSQTHFIKVINMVKYYLRSVLSSIYLIKHSERKIMEFQDKKDKI